MSRQHHHHHSSEHDTGSMKFWRSFLAFVLFLTLTATSLCACARITYISPQAMVKLFCNKDYVTALHADIKDYAEDLCKVCSVPADGTEAITYKAVYDLEETYIAGLMGTTEEYTETTYLDYIADLTETIAEQTVAANAAQGIRDDADVSDGAQQFSESLSKYITKRVEFPLADQLKTVVNLGSTGTMIGAIVFAVVSLLLGSVVVSIGHKRYRAMRELAYAATAAALMDFALIGGVKLVGLFKSLVLYPQYLADAVMAHIDRCLLTTGVAGAILFAAALCVMILVWLIKRGNNA